jgi:cystine transport system permease protein
MLAFAPDMAMGALISIALFVISMSVGSVVGLFAGILRTSKSRWLSIPALAYSWFWRALPLLFILYFGFYGLPSFGITLDAFVAAAGLMSLSTGAYLGEVVRAGIAGVPNAQWEAAAALGIPRSHAFRRIIFPQVVRISIGPYISQGTLVWKGTSLAGVVGVQELTGTTYGLINQTYVVWGYLLTAAAIYLAGSSALTWAQSRVEGSSRYGTWLSGRPA